MPQIVVTQNEKAASGLSVALYWQPEAQALGMPGFGGAFLETCFLLLDGKPVLYISMGEREQDSALCFSKQMELFAVISSKCREFSLRHAVIDVSRLAVRCHDEVRLAEVIALGLVLGTYSYAKTQDAYHFDVTGLENAHAAAFGRGIIQGEAVCEARRLTDCPANQLQPLLFASRLSAWLEPLDVSCVTIGQDELETMGMGGLLAIGKSAGEKAQPCLCVLRYQTDKKLPHTGLIGKGVTFDAGGTCLKPGSSMADSKRDMGGAAAVAAALYALAAAKTPANITVVIPMCENRLSRDSIVPGDIYRTFSGKTVEVINTDAEGRLILADAVSYAINTLGCERIIDVATLTGAVISTLGHTVAGVLTNNDSLWSSFEDAAAKAGEKYWRFPAFEEHHQMLKSDLADLKNLGESHCSVITGALFIGVFAGVTPWLHLDIAGTACVDRPYTAYQAKGATGASVLSLYRFFEAAR